MIKREQLIDYAIAAKGQWNTIRDMVNTSKRVDHHNNVDAITILDKDYPNVLMRLKQPPFVLFYKGKRELIKTRMISVVGSREVDQYGALMTQTICETIGQTFTIVSGLAKGVDALAAQSVLRDGSTIAILGCGIDTVYPRCNQSLFDQMGKSQLILSEYPGSIPPAKFRFPMRNRIIAALGDALIVTSAAMHSGTMITVNAALDMGKDVYCVPYGLDHPNGVGCNYLIYSGAYCIYEMSILPH